jgi:L-lactate dehydrogenase
MRLEDFSRIQGMKYDPAAMDDIYRQTRDAAYQIIARKGATYYAVASGLMLITRTILRDQSTVLSVSSLIDGPYGLHDVCLSLPTIVNRHGIKRVLELDLSAEELEKLRHSADILKGTFAKLAL